MTAQTDLLNKESSAGGINLKFEHQLSKVCFQFKLEQSETSSLDVFIRKIKVKGLRNKKNGCFTSDGFKWGDTYTSDSPIYTLTKANGELIDEKLTSEYQTVNTESAALLLFPQDIGSGKMSLIVSYQRVKDGLISTIVDKEITVYKNLVLEKSKQYTFKLSFKIDDADTYSGDTHPVIPVICTHSLD